MAEKRSTWAEWWFLNGGSIHRTEKDQTVHELAQLARTLPRAAWDYQQETIAALQATIGNAKAPVSEQDARIEALAQLPAYKQKLADAAALLGVELKDGYAEQREAGFIAGYIAARTT